MPNLDTTINIDVKKFLRWWGRELAFLIPRRIRRIFNDRQGRLIVRSTEDCLSLSYHIDGNVRSIGEFRRDAEGLAGLSAALAKEANVDKAEVVLRLGEREAIAKELVFPMAVIENLRQVVAYELDRYTPFKPEQAYFAVKLLEKNKSAGQIKGVLVITPREKMDLLYDELSALGLKPDRVDYENVDNESLTDDDVYSLLPEHLKQKPELLPKIVHGGLFCLSAALLLAALVLPVWWQGKAVNELRSKVNSIEKSAQEVDKLQGEIDALVARTRQLIDKKRNSPLLLVLLDKLSGLINDDTSLLHFRYTDGKLQIQGQSPSASTLIAVLEESSLFTNARFVSPVTQDARSGLERFQISVEAKAKEAK